MLPEKALRLGFKPDEVKVECFHGKYSNNWIAYVERDGQKRVLCEGGIYKMSAWKNTLQRLYLAEPNLPQGKVDHTNE